MISIDCHQIGNETVSNLEPRIEEDDSIEPLPNPSSFFNRGSQAIINDEDRSATFGNSSANSGFNHPLEIQQQLS